MMMMSCWDNTNNNTNTQDMAPAICKSSLWVIWTKVGLHQVAANS